MTIVLSIILNQLIWFCGILQARYPPLQFQWLADVPEVQSLCASMPASPADIRHETSLPLPPAIDAPIRDDDSLYAMLETGWGDDPPRTRGAPVSQAAPVIPVERTVKGRYDMYTRSVLSES